MLAWLDIQRNSEVLAKTDKKIAEKLRNQRLTEKAAKQVCPQLMSMQGHLDF